MGCMGTREQEKAARSEASLTVGERERVDLSKFSKSLAKRTTAKARQRNYQSFQSEVRPPLFREGRAVQLVEAGQWEVPGSAE